MLLNVNATLVNHKHRTSTFKKSSPTILVYCLKCLIRGRNRSLEHTPRFNGPNIAFHPMLIYVIHKCNVRTKWDIHEPMLTSTSLHYAVILDNSLVVHKKETKEKIEKIEV